MAAAFEVPRPVVPGARAESSIGDPLVDGLDGLWPQHDALLRGGHGAPHGA